MNYERQVQPTSQSPENEAITQISQKLIHEFAPISRIEIMKEVMQRIHIHLVEQLEESNAIQNGHQNNLGEFEKAFGLEQPKTANKY